MVDVLFYQCTKQRLTVLKVIKKGTFARAGFFNDLID